MIYTAIARKPFFQMEFIEVQRVIIVKQELLPQACLNSLRDIGDLLSEPNP